MIEFATTLCHEVSEMSLSSISTNSPKLEPPAAGENPRQFLLTNAGADLVGGLKRYDIWGRLGWLEVRRRYQRTVIGPFWATISFAIFVGAFGAVGAGLWHQPMGTFLPFLTAGMTIWLMLSAILTEAGTLFVGANNIFGQTRLDYSMLVYAMIWRNLIVFAHNILFFFALLLLLSPSDVNPNMLLAIPGMLVVILNCVWTTLLLGMFCLRFRDMQQFISSVIQVCLFVTPIFWPPEILTGTARGFIVSLNPLNHLIEIVRRPLLGQIPAMVSYEAAFLMTAIGWTITYFVFRSFRKRIAYWA